LGGEFKAGEGGRVELVLWAVEVREASTTHQKVHILETKWRRIRVGSVGVLAGTEKEEEG
jgi:hypothetical protein